MSSLACPLVSQKLRGSLAAGDTAGMFVTQGMFVLLWSKLLPTQQLATTIITCWIDQKSLRALLALCSDSHEIETKVAIWWGSYLWALENKPLPSSSKLVAEFYSWLLQDSSSTSERAVLTFLCIGPWGVPLVRLLKPKGFCTVEETTDLVKRPQQYGNKCNACCMSDPGLMSGIYKELKKLNTKEKQQPNFLKPDLNRELSKEEIQMTETKFLSVQHP